MEYTTLPTIVEKLKDRFKKEEDVTKAKRSIYVGKGEETD